MFGDENHAGFSEIGYALNSGQYHKICRFGELHTHFGRF